MVNTFLPYKNFERCAQVLDRSRLWKQVIEAKMIINILDGVYKSNKLNKDGTLRKPPWSHHPAVLMWTGCSQALKFYFNCMLKEWLRRGYKNNSMELYILDDADIEYPWFIGLKHFHMSHQASLMRKFKEHYSRFFIVRKKYMESDYIWPSKVKEKYKSLIMNGEKVKLQKLIT